MFAATKGDDSDKEPPSAPTQLQIVKVTQDSVTLTWKAAKDNTKVSGYIVYRDGQPVETKKPIRETGFKDTNLPQGEEFTYQVRAFDLAGNLSALSPEIQATVLAADDNHDGVPDEWVNKYFLDEKFSPNDDTDGDGLTNLQEYKAGTDPKDFFNGVKPLFELLNDGKPGPNDELAMRVKHPDGTTWPHAPVTFTVDRGARRFSAKPGGPEYVYQLRVRADKNGLALVYLEPMEKESGPTKPEPVKPSPKHPTN